MIRTLAAVVLAAATPSIAQDRAGDYDGSQTGMAAALRLTADHRFLYQLSYGALDESAEGIWAERDGKLLLTTQPTPTPPRFTVISDTPAPAGVLVVTLQDPEMLGGSSLTVALSCAGGESPIYVDVEEDGRVPVEAGCMPVSMVPDLPVFEIPLTAHVLTPGGHKLLFRFEANDLGIADFKDEPLAIDGSTLVLRRHAREIRFARR